MALVIAFGVIIAIALLSENASADVVDVSNYGSTDAFPVVDVNSWAGSLAVKNTASAINTDRLTAFADAVVPTEGHAGDLNYRNNNPGNLKYACQPGATGADENGFAIFPTWDAGMQALKNQLAKNAKDFPNFSLL